MKKSIATTSKTDSIKRRAAKENPGGFSCVDWFHANRIEKQNLFSKRSILIKTGLDGHLWPMAQDYCSPLNAIFLAEVPCVEALNSHSYWLARDGIIPLSWFFRKYPIPGKFREKILVHEEFAPLIPPAWRSNMGTYRIQSSDFAAKGEQKLLLSGLMGPVFCTLETVERNLENLKNSIGAASFEKMEKLALLFERTQLPGLDRADDFMCEYLFLLGRVGSEKKQVRAINWSTFVAKANYDNYNIFEFNEKLIYADSYSVHLALQRGARVINLLESRRPKEKGSFIRVSPYHGFFVRDYLPGTYMKAEDGDHDKMSRRYENIMCSDANLKIPWPDWISSWKHDNGNSPAQR